MKRALPKAAGIRLTDWAHVRRHCPGQLVMSALMGGVSGSAIADASMQSTPRPVHDGRAMHEDGLRRSTVSPASS